MAIRVLIFVCVMFSLIDVMMSMTRDGVRIRQLEDGTYVCRSVDIRNQAWKLDLLTNCSIVEGSVHIVLIHNAKEKDFESFSFPHLKEIAGYLLFFRVSGLKSIGQLFPNLKVIRGTMLFRDYALVIYEMVDLREVGLYNLVKIVRGWVRIEQNPALCYVDTVNWTKIAPGNNYIKNNRDRGNCSVVDCKEGCDFCWNENKCQIMDYPGCDPQCLGGCTGSGPDRCSVCRRVFHDGKCENICPPNTYEYLGRRCVTHQECLNMKDTTYFSLIADNPQRYLPSRGFCIPGRKDCPGIKVDSIAAAQSLRGCTHINGTLMIQMHHDGNVVSELEKNLNSIQEITGSLKISRSFFLSSLNFLANLSVIHGEILEKGKYSLVVMNNDNLMELWDWKTRGPKSFSIKRGSIFFHFNPMLCISKIDELREIAGLSNYTNIDVARESNGNNAACNVIEMQVWVKVQYSTSVIVRWQPCMLPSCESFVTYMLYYIPTPYQNISIYDGCDICNNEWSVIDLRNPGNLTQYPQDQPLTHLKPYTQYAYYVKVYSMTATVGRTDIQYFRTLPDRPTTPHNFIPLSRSENAIVLQWQPPVHPNGDLSHYIISGKLEPFNQKYLDQRNYCTHKSKDFHSRHVDITVKGNVKKMCCEEEDKISEISDVWYKSNCRKMNEIVSLEKMDACEMYLHTVLHESLIKLLPETDRFPNYIGEDDLTAPDIPVNQNISKNGVYESFVYRIAGDTTNFTLKNLSHFSKYTIHLLACRKPVDIADNLNDKALCSFANILSTRTLPNYLLDKIFSGFVSAGVYNNSMRDVLLSWKSPRNPNGVIVMYHVEYRRIDIENANPITECITRKQYDLNGGGYILRNLPPGKYGFRVRATSLAGKGNFTKMIEYVVQNPQVKLPTIAAIAISLIVVVVIFSAVGIIFYWRVKVVPSRLDRFLVASVNPEYLSFEPYVDDEWEMPSENVELIKEVGHGSFGTVYEGILKGSDTPCAVKTIAVGSSLPDKMRFLCEASVMKTFAGAYHIVKLIGVVSKSSIPMVVMELMALGDLKSYLRASREESTKPDLKRLTLMAAQIADGMAFLEAKKFVHRDLAARNCMVSSDFTVKIGDFGMTRDIYENDYYRTGTSGLLPVRWMAPESLKDGVFTSQSDVWSYGVVLWEMTTLGESPHQGLGNNEVLHLVLTGGTLTPPPRCSEILSQIMLSCWMPRPYWRPRFLQILEDLEKATELDGNFRMMSFFHSQAGREAKAAMEKPGIIVSHPSYCNYQVSFFHVVDENEEVGEKTQLLKRDCPLLPQLTPETEPQFPEELQRLFKQPSVKYVPKTEEQDESEYIGPDSLKTSLGNNGVSDKEGHYENLNGTIKNGFPHRSLL